jgi:cob(I)alamin adenosyltransferase
MVILNKIYTRTGDGGITSLGTGKRVKKHSLRISAYGTIDETNACIGLVRLHTQDEAVKGIDQMLARIQNDLFDLGADLCAPDTGEKLEYTPLRIADEQVVRLENEIDLLNSELSPLRSFVLPGGSAASAALHLARTTSRRAERLIVELDDDDTEPVGEPVIKYINRLSDFLFVASRYLNNKGDGDVLWVPGQNQ